MLAKLPVRCDGGDGQAQILGNLAVALNGITLEQNKAEAARILEIIKTSDSEQACNNLQLLLQGNLIVDEDIKKGIQAYLLIGR